MKATLRFQNIEQSEEFITGWSRATSKGHTVRIKDFTSGETEVTVYNVSKKGKEFIDNYAAKLNK
jgi:hypothetical protein